MSKEILISIIFALISSIGCQDCSKNPRLPQCRISSNANGQKKTCDPFYLIPGKSNECGKKLGGRYLSIDPSTVIITGDNNGDIKLPGCFTIQFNVEVLDASKLDQSFLAKMSFDWVNLREFSNLPCKNQSNNGCNGYGNNCHYCDICDSLKRLKTDTKVADSTLAKQFSDFTCPIKPGIYLLKKEICFKDFSELDKNNNCELDALETAEGQQYKNALNNLQQNGFGTVIAKFLLATNATEKQNADKAAKESQIEQSAANELISKRNDNQWAVNDAEYKVFKEFFVKGRSDMWYKSEFLPRLLEENEVGCLAVSFTVCDKPPTKNGDQKVCPTKSFW